MPNFNKLRWIVYEIFDNSQLFLTDPRIATQERKNCDMEIKIVTFVINGSMKLTFLPIDNSKSK